MLHTTRSSRSTIIIGALCIYAQTCFTWLIEGAGILAHDCRIVETRLCKEAAGYIISTVEYSSQSVPESEVDRENATQAFFFVIPSMHIC